MRNGTLQLCINGILVEEHSHSYPKSTTLYQIDKREGCAGYSNVNCYIGFTPEQKL